MKYIPASTGLLLAVVLSACVPSLHPFYTETDLVFDPALLGEWVEAPSGAKSTLTFARGADQQYKLTVVDDGETSSYTAHLVRLGCKLFLDISDDPDVHCRTVSWPVHMFFLVSQIEPMLKVRIFKPEWLEEYLKKRPAALRHEIVDRKLVLTASTKELQSFVLHHLSIKEAFGDDLDYVRTK